MVLGAAPPSTTTPAPAEQPLTSTSFLIGRALISVAIVGLVDRKAHPFVWWGLGLIPLGFGAAELAVRAQKPRPTVM